MTPAGYIAKKIHTDTGWLENPVVEDICSVSNCICEVFCDYIPYWKHNGYWLFDSPELVRAVAQEAAVDLSGHPLFYYEVYERQYAGDSGVWQDFGAEPKLETNVRVPAEKQLLGFDVVSFSTGGAPECSPLSCNGLAASGEVNHHCLFVTFDAAKAFVESGALKGAEPGPYRIFSSTKTLMPSGVVGMLAPSETT